MAKRKSVGYKTPNVKFKNRKTPKIKVGKEGPDSPKIKSSNKKSNFAKMPKDTKKDPIHLTNEDYRKMISDKDLSQETKKVAQMFLDRSRETKAASETKKNLERSKKSVENESVRKAYNVNIKTQEKSLEGVTKAKKKSVGKKK